MAECTHFGDRKSTSAGGCRPEAPAQNNAQAEGRSLVTHQIDRNDKQTSGKATTGADRAVLLAVTWGLVHRLPTHAGACLARITHIMIFWNAPHRAHYAPFGAARGVTKNLHCV
jgi:hypothetical protein